MVDGTLAETGLIGKNSEKDYLLGEILNGSSNRICQILGHFVHFLQMTLSPDHKKMYALGTKFDVYGTVENLYK